MLEYLMVLGHQQVQCSLQNHTYNVSFYVMKFHWLPPSNYCSDPVFRRHTMQAPQRQSITNEWNRTVLRLRQNGCHFSEEIFQHIFVNENVWISIKISLKFVPKGQINNIQALVQIMAWCRPGDKPLSEPMMVSLLMHICVTWPQWV